jgi:hypothetical protein
MIAAVCPDEADRHDLLTWQGNQGAAGTPEIDRLHKALLGQPRKWADWKKLACSPAEINGHPIKALTGAAMATPENKRPYRPQVVTPMYAIRCPHCGTEYDPLKLHVENTYPNFRRHICLNKSCGRPFVSKITSTASLVGGLN